MGVHYRSIYEIAPTEQFELRVGPALSSQLRWTAYACKVDNPTPQWVRITNTLQYVPPGVTGYVVPIPSMDVAAAEFAAPPGVAQPPANPDQQAVLTFYSYELPPSGATLSVSVGTRLPELTVTGVADVQGDLTVEGAAHFKGPIPWIDVQHPAYGAVGNDVHVDTPNINTATAAAQASTYGAIVLFPPGSYAVDGFGLATYTNVTMAGIGRRSIIHYVGNVVSPNVLTVPGGNPNNQGTNASNVTVHDLAFLGAAATQLGVAGGTIYFTSVSNTIVMNVYVNGNNSVAIRHVSCINTQTLNCEVQACAGGIWNDSCASYTVQTSNVLAGSQDDGISAYGFYFDVTDGVISGCRVKNVVSPASGITVDVASSVTASAFIARRFEVVGSTITNCGAIGMVCGGGARDGSFVSITITSSANKGVWVSQRSNGAGGPFTPTNVLFLAITIDTTTSVNGFDGGFVIEAFVAGTALQGIKLIGVRVYNAGNAGIFIHASAANCTIFRITLDGCEAVDTHGGAAVGLYCHADANGCVIEVGVTGGRWLDDGAGTQQIGIQLNYSGSGTIQNSQFLGCDVRGNVAQNVAISAGGAGSVASSVVFRHCPGYNDVNRSIVAEGTAWPNASGVALLNSSHRDCGYYFKAGAGTITDAGLDGNGLGLSVANGESCTILVPAGAALNVSYGAPGPTYAQVGY